MKRLIGFKKQFKEMMKDEKGVTATSESLILIVGTSIVAIAVVGTITIMLIGDKKDGTGGITKSVTNNVDKMMEQILPDAP